jgi:hypothetical protein
MSATAAQEPKFSGTWALDKSRSEGLPAGMDQTMTVEQTGDRIDIVMTVFSDQGEREVRDQFILDGKETEFAPAENSKGKRTSTWSADGRGFDVIEEATIERGAGPESFKVMRHWRLSDDGKTLTIEMSFNEPSGPGKSKRVFVKK